MKIEEMKAVIDIPEGIEIKIVDSTLIVKGAKGELEKEIRDPKIQVKLEDKKIVLIAKKATKREKTQIGTFKAHIKNLIKGVSEGFNYKLKICASHFPMNVSINNNEMIIKNFLGEKIPRKIKIVEGVNVKIEGDLINIEGLDKEKTGQTAASIEQKCRITNRDKRVFQDGIYIIEKAGKEM